MYLQNSANFNSKHARILNELTDFDFVIKFKPGRENLAADYLSRLPLSESENCDLSDFCSLPPGLEHLHVVPGGGDSLLESLFCVLLNHHKFKDPSVVTPSDFNMLRSLLVNKLLGSPSKYGLDNNKRIKQMLRIMLQPGHLPCPEIILAFSEIYKLSVVVHYGGRDSVVFDVSSVDSPARVHLQCLASVHYNPLQENLCYGDSEVCTRPFRPSSDLDSPRADTTVETSEVIVDNVDVNLDFAMVMYDFETDEHDELSLEVGDTVQISDCSCSQWWYGHSNGKSGYFPSNYVLVSDCSFDFSKYGDANKCHDESHIGPIHVYCHGFVGCAMLDTGAEISCVARSFISPLVSNGSTVVTPSYTLLVGVGPCKSAVTGVVVLDIAVPGMSVLVSQKFAVVDDSVISSCIILGSNFMQSSEIGLSFDPLSYVISNCQHRYSMIKSKASFKTNDLYINCVSSTDVQSKLPRPSCLLDDASIALAQKRDHALKILRVRVLNKSSSSEWRSKGPFPRQSMTVSQ